MQVDPQKVRSELRKAAAELAAAVHAHAIELASEKLRSRRPKFLESLSFKQINDDLYVIALDVKADWINDGLKPFDMKPGMLKSRKAKTAADGSRYLVVPFEHGAGKVASTVTPAEKNLIDTLKTHMKKKKIPWGKIEKDSSGNPKLGLLHSFDVDHAPIKTKEGPGTGKGPIGSVMQGPTGIPLLQSVRVYQKRRKDGTVKRSIMTFRTVSSKHGDGRWHHPGLAPENIMNEAAEWGLQQWETVMGPRVVEAIVSGNR